MSHHAVCICISLIRPILLLCAKKKKNNNNNNNNKQTNRQKQRKKRRTIYRIFTWVQRSWTWNFGINCLIYRNVRRLLTDTQTESNMIKKMKQISCDFYRKLQGIRGLSVCLMTTRKSKIKSCYTIGPYCFFFFFFGGGGTVVCLIVAMPW